LREVIGATGGERVLYVNRIGAEGIVSKSRGNLYRGGASRDWLKTKVFSNGFGVLAQGLEAIHVAEEQRGGPPRQAGAGERTAGRAE
jgi:ATP-dependent DNA ligase